MMRGLPRFNGSRSQIVINRKDLRIYILAIALLQGARENEDALAKMLGERYGFDPSVSNIDLETGVITPL